MFASNVTEEDLYNALFLINTEYDNNVKFKLLRRESKNGKRYKFHLSIINSKYHIPVVKFIQYLIAINSKTIIRCYKDGCSFHWNNSSNSFVVE